MQTLKAKREKFDLLANAKDSLNHMVEHFSTSPDPSAGNLKRSILDIVHVVELVLKERLRRAHPALIWENVDRYPSRMARTVTIEKAIGRLRKIEKIRIPENQLKSIDLCIKLRNEIMHYEFQIDKEASRAVAGRLLSFILFFTKTHLGLNWEGEFKSDKKWKALIDIKEFWEAHSKELEKKLAEEGVSVLECPSCHAVTYDIFESKCELCGHSEERTKCDICGEEKWESEIESRDDVDGDIDSGLCHYSYNICTDCLEGEAEAGAFSYDEDY